MPAISLEELDTARVGGFDTVRSNRKEIAEWIAKVCIANRSAPALPVLMFSSNGQGIALAGSNPEYDDAMNAADVIHADGMPVVLASRLLTSTPIRERSCTTDLFHDIATVAIEHGLKFYVLGGREEQNRAAVCEMQRLYPSLRIVGRRNGYFPDEESMAVCAEIVASGADILWVGLGKPRQEIWSHQHRIALRGVGCIKTCGGLYSYLTGDAPRAPLWMQKAGLEWLFRLLTEPRRLFVRYFVTNARSAWRLMRYSG